MLKRLQKLIPLPFLLSVLIVISSCGNSGVGTIPAGTPDLGNGTPAVIPTAKPSPQEILTAPPTAKGAYYAFVRGNQLEVARNGANPIQMTSFNYPNVPNVFWHQPLWSQDHRFIAFIMTAQPAGLGGGGCPGPDYSANGSLYLLNTATGKLSKLVVPADSSDALASSSYNGFWQYIFWQDPTHLLAWYNGIIGKTSSTAGLYRYDLNSGKLSQILPLSMLSVGTLYNVQKDLPLMLSMRYSSRQLFYQVIVHPFEQNSQFVIYRHSVLHSEVASSKVLETGSEPWCAPHPGGPYFKPGWDVSPDGGQLVAQMIMGDSSGQGTASVTVLNLNDGSTTGLFTQASSQMLSHDLMLTWGPDSQSVVATQYHMLSEDGPYSATLANPAVMQQYAPNLAGQVSWRPDGSAFALENADTTPAATAINQYMFAPGETQGRLLLTDAQDFVWG